MESCQPVAATFDLSGLANYGDILLPTAMTL
jgi:hypothetical protein